VRIVEIGAGFGSLTVALARAGAEVLAIEIDRGIARVLSEMVAGFSSVRVIQHDALRLDWKRLLKGDAWVLCGNLPYNIATSIVLDALEQAPNVHQLVVMVQREIGERLVATPGTSGYGAVSVRTAYRATGAVARRVPPDVFWPRPSVESVVVRLQRRRRPAVDVDHRSLWRVVDAGFAQRRKTMRNALRRVGLEASRADAALVSAGVAPAARAEELDLETFARIAREITR